MPVTIETSQMAVTIETNQTAVTIETNQMAVTIETNPGVPHKALEYQQLLHGILTSNFPLNT